MCRRENEEVSSESTFEIDPPRVPGYSKKWQRTLCTVWSKIYNAIFLLGFLAFIIWVLKVMFYYFFVQANTDSEAIKKSSLINPNGTKMNLTSSNFSDVSSNGTLQFWNDIGTVKNRYTNGTFGHNSIGWMNSSVI